MVRVAAAAGSVEAFLRTKPPAIYRDDPHSVVAAAHDLYGATTSDPVDYLTFQRHLYARGVEPRQTGERFWLVFGG